MSTDKRDQIVYNAKLAEQAERYDEMKEYMKQVAHLGQELSVEERNLLSVAYKNAVGARRASWRIVSSVEERKRNKAQFEHANLAAQYRSKVEAELNQICEDILVVLGKFLIESATSAESKVFFYKMKGDYYRYIAEFATAEKKKAPTDQAEEAYATATQLAEQELPATHPIRLGLALNFSVFYYEILGQSAKACEMAKKAFDSAIAELDSVSEDSFRDSTLIMHLLRETMHRTAPLLSYLAYFKLVYYLCVVGDNLTLWAPNPDDDVPGETTDIETKQERLE